MPAHPAAYYREILDAIPLMVFVVDDDVRVQDMNAVAATVFNLKLAAIRNRRGGEILHCLHAHDVPEGCGRAPFCKDCVIRNSVGKSIGGSGVVRRRAKVELLIGEVCKGLELLITTSPITLSRRRQALLILEDISEISVLRELIPICCRCHKVRNDQQYWQTVESYFATNVGVDFSHGICPGCARELYPELSPERLPPMLSEEAPA